MTQIDIFPLAGSFAENKDTARDIRVNQIIPTLEKNEEVTLNFDRVSSTTQSFIHALISDAIRKHGNDSLDLMVFKSCNNNIQQIIKIVVEYMQKGLEKESEETT